jgi:hypothetical protein
MPTTYTTTGVPVLAWPAQVKPSEFTPHLRFNTSGFTSPYTRTTQTTELPGALWEIEANFPPLKSTQVPAMRALFASLRGQAGRFHFPVYACRYAPPAMYGVERITLLPLTADNTYITADTTTITADATHVQMEPVFGVSACPDAVTIVGTLWLNSRRAPLQVGSWISWDDATGWRQLHIVTGLNHNATTGAATLTVEPPMRALPTPATPMHVYAPSAIFKLVDDGQGALRQAGRLTSFTLAIQQAHPVQVMA